MSDTTPKFCPSCGSPVTTESHFCASCGTSLLSSAYNPPVQSTGSYGVPAGQPIPSHRPEAAPKKKRGWLVVLLVIVVLIGGLIAILALNGGEVSFSTANLSEYAMAAEVDPVLLTPTVKADVFSTDAPIVYATMLVKNAPEDTLVTAKWVYEDESYEIGTAELLTTQASQYLAFHLTMPDTGFPVGSYRVDISLNGEFQKSMTFKVE